MTMKNITKKLKLTALITLITVAAAGAAVFDFHVWSLKHPEAPTWTYFMK